MVFPTNPIAVDTSSTTQIMLTDTATSVTFPDTGISNAYLASWSPDGQYLAIAFGDTSPNVQVYKRNRDTFTLLVSLATGINFAWSAAWSPDGQYLAIAFGASSPNVQVYKRNEDTFTPIAFPTTESDAASSVAWSPDGQYLAVTFVACMSSPNVQIYKFHLSAEKEYLLQVDSDNTLPLITGLSVRPS
jgi:WD40 repeat protein